MSKHLKPIFMLLILCIFTGIPCHVSEAKTCEDADILVNLQEARKMAKETALEWAEALKPNINLSADDVQDVITPDGSWEFVVSYAKGKSSYGYASVIVDENGAVVKKAVLDKGAETPAEEIQEQAEALPEVQTGDTQEPETLVALDDLNYAAVYEDEQGEEVYVDENGQVYSDDFLCSATEYKDEKTIFIKTKNWVSTKYKVNSKTELILPKYTAKHTLIEDKRAINLLNYYACSIQSLMQIAYMEGLIDSYSDKNIKAFYNDMRNRNIIVSKKYNGSYYVGSTFLEKAAKGFIKYAVDAGYTGTEFKGNKVSPDINWIRNKIEYNRPILFAYEMNINGKKEGHMISILGAMKAKKVSSGNTWNYIKVYNGWYNLPAYINYDCVDFVSSRATYFWVKK